MPVFDEIGFTLDAHAVLEEAETCLRSPWACCADVAAAMNTDFPFDLLRDDVEITFLDD